MPKESVKHLPVLGRQGDRLKAKLAARQSSDLVFAVVGYLGSGASLVARLLSEQANVLGFTPLKIELSRKIAERSGIPLHEPASIARTRSLQDGGDELRKKYGASFVAGLGINQIYEIRQQVDEARPRLFIIDSLKHQAEVEILREIYGSSFYLIAVVCNESTRKGRLRKKFKHEPPGQDSEVLNALMKDDRKGAEDFGQQVRKTSQLADFFIANEDQDEEGLATQLDRFLLAVTGREVVRPTRDERGMHAAWSASLRSSCMSRQVGAAIVGPNGELLATGTNDPPAPGGGVYQVGSEPDHRCFKWPGDQQRSYCRNDRAKQDIYKEVYTVMNEAGLLSATNPEAIARALGSTRIGALIEFSRAIHAEMDALLQIARHGGGIPKQTSLFGRVYPCHSCARHIVAAGIAEVVYIEPYDKSMAIELHADAIREVSVPKTTADDDTRVIFRLFSGVAPRRYAALFEKRRDLKDARGALIQVEQAPGHTDPVLTGSFLDLEKELAADVQAALDS
ncbi:anti-phage dCTP deaminase [Enhygromyxa salina]|uniref:CMP/dCMP-type deaminase domain-containing protein n=1 Tax=Enhygromyxa salina TaxID=215803 RepID=A0A2S9XTI8_9BACT|nr:anti-phage dCTP deaminase [Enhygromyxa salina]PRP96172.1 hypothetical protein ENSA7_69860 [Enhygromyxa salina]